MAHVPDGVLSLPVLGLGALACGGLVALALRRSGPESVPRAAVLASVFFAGSMLAVPIGPSSVHPMFSALSGILLGLMALPAVLAALVLQFLLFGFGGVTSLGVNALNIALPGMIAGMALRPLLAGAPAGRAALLAGIGGGLAVLGTGAMVALSLAASAAEYVPAARVMLAVYLPLALVEAVICGSAIGYLQRARPDGWLPRPVRAGRRAAEQAAEQAGARRA